MPAFLALRELRQEDSSKLEARMSYTVSDSPSYTLSPK